MIISPKKTRKRRRDKYDETINYISKAGKLTSHRSASGSCTETDVTYPLILTADTTRKAC